MIHDLRLADAGLRSFAHMDSADLRGIVLRSGGQLRALCLGGDLGDGPVDAAGRGASFLVEKSDLSVPGAGYDSRKNRSLPLAVWFALHRQDVDPFTHSGVHQRG